jgi:Mrp family chromosome partitioning ATPase
MNDTQKKTAYTIAKKPFMRKERLMQHRIVAMQHNTIEAGAFKILRTKLFKKLKANNWNSFAITSPTKNAGKTTVAVNLALVMAMESNQTILLVDMNLKNPTIHRYFDIKVRAGLKDCIISNYLLSDVLISPSVKRLVVLPGKDQIVHSSEMITTPKMRTLVEEFKSYYLPQITIFDLPPVLNSDDVLASIDYYDALLLVVEEGGNSPDDVENSLKMLSESHLLGTVLNKSRNVSST